jgi:hypothetical protein
MSKVVALTRGSEESTTAPKKRERERLVNIETPPNPEWFVRTREQGRTVWYLRLRLTGMFPRRFGPFRNRHRALLALDNMIHAMTDVTAECQDAAGKYGLNRRFQNHLGPVIEDDLALPKGAR